jgi:hypothetical protein
LHKLLGYEKDLLLATTPRKQQQKLLGTTISLRWWASLYNLLDQVNIFICKILIFLAFYETLPALVLMYPSHSLLGYAQFLCNFVENNGGVLPLFCLVKGELPKCWMEKSLPMEISQLSSDNLEWSLTCLARIKKKFCVPKEL